MFPIEGGQKHQVRDTKGQWVLRLLCFREHIEMNRINLLTINAG